jgi:hypothetical protein
MGDLEPGIDIYEYSCEVFEPGGNVNSFYIKHKYKEGYAPLIIAVLKHDFEMRDDDDSLHGADIVVYVRIVGTLIGYVSMRPEPDDTTTQKGACSHWLEIYEPDREHNLVSTRMIHRRSEGYHSLVAKALMHSPNKRGRKAKKATGK